MLLDNEYPEEVLDKALSGGGAKSKKVDLLRYFWKIDLEKIYFFYFFDLYFCFLKAFFGLKYTS